MLHDYRKTETENIDKEEMNAEPTYSPQDDHLLSFLPINIITAISVMYFPHLITVPK